MTRAQRSALALIAGITGSLVVMALHPTGADVARVAAAGGTSHVARNVHLFAIALQPLLMAGTLGLTLQLRRHADLAALAFISYALGTVAIMLAATCSGLLAPELIAEGVRATEAAVRDGYLSEARLVGRINQAMAQLWVGFTGAAIVLWGLAMRGEAAFGVWVRGIGFVVGGAGVVLLVSGGLALDVRGFGVVVLVLSGWIVAVGWALWRAEASAAPS